MKSQLFKKMKKIIEAFTLIFLMLIANSCKKSIVTESNVNEFSEYISVFPDKLISVTPNLKFVLKKKVTTNFEATEVITTKPAIKGEVVLNDNELVFVPAEKLKSNQEYSITLHLSKLYEDVDENLEDFTVNVKTKELLFNVSLQSPSVYNKNLYAVEGELIASDIIETEKVSSLVKATYNGKAKPIKFSTVGKVSSKVYFKIDSIQRFEDDKQLKVEWTGAPVQSESKGSREVTITGKNNFKVLSVEVIDTEKQHIEISFSDPLQKSQNLKGLIQFLNTQKRAFTYKVNSNKVTVYPKSSFRQKVDIEIFKGIKSTDGYALKENTIKTVYFEELKPAVKFIKSGSILPNSSNLKINFSAVNLKAVDATVYKVYKENVLQFLQYNDLSNQGNLRYVGRPVAKYTVNLGNQGLDLSKENAFAIDLAEIVKVENGAMYRVEFSFNKDYSNYKCDEGASTKTIVFGKKEIDTKSYDSPNYYDDYYYDYSWRDRENPCTTSYYYNKNISTNILATNIGVIVKKGNNNKIVVAVTDILTTNVIEGAKVTLYNLQKQEIASATTNKEGVVSFSDVTNAFFAVVTKNNNTTYIKLKDG
ncbi:hypothetical protein CSC82_30205, partial [Rhodobacteraceae bacterium 4F10]